MNKQKGLALILIVLLIAAALGGYLIYQRFLRPLSKVQQIPQSTVAPSVSSDETSDWKIYEQKDIGLSFWYPADWEIKELNDDKYKEGNWSGVVIKGQQGEVELLWGWGFGGACPEGYEDIQIRNKKLRTCHGLDQEGNEKWNQITGVSGKQIGSYGKVGFTARATAYSPYQTNRNTILEIITSIDLKGWN